MNIDPRLLRRAGKSRLALFLTIGLGFGSGVLAVAQARLLSRAIAHAFLGGDGLAALQTPLLLLLGVIGLRAALAWGSEAAANSIALRVKACLRGELLEKLLALGPAYTGGERTGELAHTAVEGVEALDAYFSQYLPQVVLAALVPLTFLLFVFPLDPLSGIVLLATAPLIPLFMALIGGAAQGLTRRQWRSLSRMSAYFLDVIQGLTTLKLLGRSQAQAGVIAEVSNRFRQATMSVLRVSFLSALALELLSTLSTAVVAVEVGLRLLYGRLDFEAAFFILVLAPEFYLPLRLLGARFHAGMAGVEAGKRIFEILETGNQRSATGNREPEPGCLSPVASGRSPTIEFDSVSYTYAPGRPALQGVSFRVEAGQKVALVGPSGAGKSTVAALLLRFLEPQAGCIRVDGRPLEAQSPEQWREQVAWIPQQPHLFYDTVAANICLGRPQASREEVETVARLAHAHDFIAGLPQGYETLIGERGARLSSGQAQRIALARAFLTGAPFLILDEASANLDPEHEARLTDSLACLLAGRTAVIIAHRLNTVISADRILVLEKGQVVESGTHAVLLAQGGLYTRMVTPEDLSPLPPPLVGKRGDPGQSLGKVSSLPGEWSAGQVRNLPGQMADRKPARPDSSRQPPLLRLLSLARPFAGLAALSALLGFGTIASSVGLLATSAYLLSAAALHPSIAVLQVPIVGVRFFGLARGVFRYLERYVSHEVTFRLLAEQRVRFYRALEPLAPARLLELRSGDLLGRIVGDIGWLENFYVRVLAPPLTAALAAIGLLIFLGSYGPELALSTLGLLLAAGMGVPLVIRRLARGPGRQEVQARAALSAALVDAIQGLPDLLAFGAGGRHLAHVLQTGKVLAHSQRQMARLGGLQSALVGLFSNLGMWAVLVLSISLMRAGRLDPVYLAVLALAALAGFELVQPLPLAAQYLESSLESARRLFAVVDGEPAVSPPVQPLPPPGRFEVEVRNLSFAYPGLASLPSPHPPRGSSDHLDPAASLPPIPSPGRGWRGDWPPKPGAGGGEPWALQNVTFRLPPGHHLAIVGPSGAGKSTIARLLLRFWEFQVGEILLGAGSAAGDLRRYAPEAVRSRIALVSQDTYLFNSSVRANLLLAKPDATEAEMVRAAQAAQFHDFVLSLPQGYDTWIGEQGQRLSGGERQRLAIARALLQDAPLLILDEPTANLDAITGRQVLTTFRTLMEGRSTIMITHHLRGLEGMDEILVLEAGRVVEHGRHEELLALGGLYRRMWEVQRGRLEKA